MLPVGFYLSHLMLKERISTVALARVLHLSHSQVSHAVRLEHPLPPRSFVDLIKLIDEACPENADAVVQAYYAEWFLRSLPKEQSARLRDSLHSHAVRFLFRPRLSGSEDAEERVFFYPDCLADQSEYGVKALAEPVIRGYLDRMPNLKEKQVVGVRLARRQDFCDVSGRPPAESAQPWISFPTEADARRFLWSMSMAFFLLFVECIELNRAPVIVLMAPDGSALRCRLQADGSLGA